jgi:peptidyl-Lys metalloendopeptidase
MTMPTPTYLNLNDKQKTQASSAYNQVRTLLGKADAVLIKADFNAANQTEEKRFTTWFGPYNQTNVTTAKNIIHTMLRQLEGTSNLTFDGAGAHCAPGIVAYVMAPGGAPAAPVIVPAMTVYLCGAFFTAPLLGRDSQVGTIIHEVSHLVGRTTDVPKPGGGAYPDGFTETYGEKNCKWLAAHHPNLALSNADNFLFYCCSFS